MRSPLTLHSSDIGAGEYPSIYICPHPPDRDIERGAGEWFATLTPHPPERIEGRASGSLRSLLISQLSASIERGALGLP